MPLYKTFQINEHKKIGIWKIEESASFFEDLIPAIIYKTFITTKKNTQHFAVRHLLKILKPTIDLNNMSTVNNKPLIKNQATHFSFSHSDVYAATMVHNSAIGLDIQVYKNEYANKICRVVPKFLSKKEMDFFDTTSVLTLAILWTIKEALFKALNKNNLAYAEALQISLESLNLDHSTYFHRIDTFFTTSIMTHAYSVYYKIDEAFIIAYCDLNQEL